MPPPMLDSPGRLDSQIPDLGGLDPRRRRRLRSILDALQQELGTDEPEIPEPPPPTWKEQKEAGVPVFQRTNTAGVSLKDHLIHSLGDVAASLAGAKGAPSATGALYGRRQKERDDRAAERKETRKERQATLRSVLPSAVSAALKDEDDEKDQRTSKLKEIDWLVQQDFYKNATPAEQTRLREGILSIPAPKAPPTPKDLQSEAYERRRGVLRANTESGDPDAPSKKAAYQRYVDLTTKPGHYPTARDPQGRSEKLLTHDEAVALIRKEKEARAGIDSMYPQREPVPDVEPDELEDPNDPAGIGDYGGGGGGGDLGEIPPQAPPGALDYSADADRFSHPYDPAPFFKRYPGMEQFFRDNPDVRVSFGGGRGGAGRSPAPVPDVLAPGFTPIQPPPDAGFRPPMGPNPDPGFTPPIPPIPGIGPNPLRSPMGNPIAGPPPGTPPGMGDVRAADAGLPMGPTNPQTGAPLDAQTLLQLIQGFRNVIGQGHDPKQVIEDFKRQWGFDPTAFEGAFAGAR